MTTEPTTIEDAAPTGPAVDGGHPILHDATRPPRWFGRALVMGVVAVFLGIFAWYAMGALQNLGVTLLISFFLALALEPMTVWLVRHGWRRGAAAMTVLLGSVATIVVLIVLFSGLFFDQLSQLIARIPDIYAQLTDWVSGRFTMDLPAQDDLINTAVKEYGTDAASQVFGIGTSIVGGIFSFFTTMLVVYYLLAAGPRFRAAICRWLTPNRQQEVLQFWEITQVKVSDFINTRIVLAALNAFFTFVFLTIIQTPYSLPLALFCGIVSQFVPTIGTYIGGALPTVVALTAQGAKQGAIVLAFIIVYQQIENMVFSPRVSAKALEMNPAVSFIVVLAFGALFGPLGAFLGLPIAATIQAIANTYLQRHDLIESAMLRDPEAAERPAVGAHRTRLAALRRRLRTSRRPVVEETLTVPDED